MSRTIKSVLYYENRINKLINNGKENASVVKKLERQKRKAEKLENK